MIYQNYDQVKQLDSSIIDQLLSNGDAQERVWAAWEIGLRLGKKAWPSISLQIHKAPDAGTRRHMIVVMAGLGHYSVLSTLAIHDPNESVRGTAVQYLIKTTDQNDTEKINLIIDVLVKDKSPIVKQSILDHWNFYQLKIPFSLLMDCAKNKFKVVRNAAIKQIINNYSANDFSTNQIADLFAYQTGKESIYLFSNWLLNWNLGDALILSAEKAPLSSKLIILDFLIEKNLTFSWKSLKKMSQLKNPDADIRLLRILKIEKNFDLLLWLAFGMSRAINLPMIKSRSQYLEQLNASNFYDIAKNHFLSLLKNMPPQKINFSNLKNFLTVLNYLENDLLNDIEIFNEDNDEFFGENEDFTPEDYIKDTKINCASLKKWQLINTM